ncbi:MAG: sugar ABC transporter substrate-binding protein [Bifidobacteriaceae bacterium]|jgi:multiple sugar transport system substrate-binding protein|nr:sugar ABC transporter substrate-binding protein [Bifidobacteriaceae bacterium]
MSHHSKLPKALALLAASAMMFTGLAACGDDKGGTDATDTPAASQTEEAPPVDTSDQTEAADEETTPAGTEDTEPASTEPGVDDGTELTMWTRAPLERQANMLVDAYNASHQNQVKLEIIPNDDMEAKVAAAVVSGGMPDLLAGDVVRLPYWVDQGFFTPITDKIQALPYYDDLAVGHIDAGKSNDGALHTVPFVTDISVMVWNKDLYEEAGLDPEKGPTTLQEFVDQAKAVADLNKEGVAGTYFGGDCGGCLVFTWFPFVWGNGSEVLSADGTESLMASDDAKAVYAAFRELAEYPNGLGAGTKEENGGTWTAPFAEGKIGVMPYPNTSATGARDAGINVGAAPIPGINSGFSTFLGGDAMGITSGSEKVDQAWNFLAWLTSEDAQLNVIAADAGVPARVSLLDNEFTAQDPLAVAMNSSVANGRTPVAIYFAEAFNASGSPWVQTFRAAVWGDADEVDALNDEITAVLQQ